MFTLPGASRLRCGALVTVAVALAACSYHERKGPANEQPIAAIDKVVDGRLRIAATVEVVVSAETSRDPDGDPLTYAWTIDPACAPSAPADLTSVNVHFSGLVAGSSCAIAVTVTDPFGASAEAAATLLVLNVGAYVSSSDCLDAYDPLSDAEQGTTDHPFCALVDGLAAAHDFQIAEVPVASDVQTLDDDLVVNHGITIRGGYDRSSWTPGLGYTAIALSGAADVDPTFRIDAGDATVTLASLAIARTKRCVSTDCKLIAATSSLELSHVALGMNVGGATNMAASGGVYYSVAVQGPTDDSPPISFAVNDLQVTGASGATSIAIAVNDAVDASITAANVSEGPSRYPIGLRLTRAGNIVLTSSQFMARGDDSSGSRAVGIVDGDLSVPGLDDCSATFGTLCKSSASLTINGGGVDVGHAKDAVGIGALGTGAIRFNLDGNSLGLTVHAAGQRAVGVMTMGIGTPASVAAPNMATMVSTIAVSTSVNAAEVAYAYGWSDGFDGDPNPANGIDERTVVAGSYGMQLESCSFSAFASSASVYDLAGLLLRGTSAIAVNNPTVIIGSKSGHTEVLSRIAGIRLMRTDGLNLGGGTITMSQLAGSITIGGIIDGQLNGTNEDIDYGGAGLDFASTNLNVLGTTVSGPMEIFQAAMIEPYPIRAGVHLYATRQASIIATTINGSLVGVNGYPPTAAGIVTMKGADIALTDNTINVGTSEAADNIRVIGIQDGSQIDYTLGSSRLIVERNVITLAASGASAIGVRLVGTSDDPMAGLTAVDNNFIQTTTASASTGILAQVTNALIAFNSVRGPPCVACANSAFATGVYALHIGGSNDLRVLANTFSAPEATYGAAMATPAIVEHRKASGTVALSAIVANVFGWETAVETPVLLASFVDSNATFATPRGVATALSEANINTSTGTTTASGNNASSPKYCADGRHGTLAGPQHNGAGDVTATMVATGGASPSFTDIDRAEHPINGDSGADAITTCP